MNILGISAFYHDSAACLINNGEIINAVQEERFTRIKHDAAFPKNAIKFCIKNLKCSNIDYIVFYDKPFLKFDRLIETYLAFAPQGFKTFSKSMPLWIKDKLFQKLTIINELKNIFGKNFDETKLLFSEHHLSHSASAFFPSPFRNSSILTMDGVGEWSTTSVGMGEKNKLEILKEIEFPHSIGLLYSAFTYYAGFKVNSGEYKLMGLAPYGKPIYTKKIYDNLIDIKEDGSFKLNMEFFNYCTGLTMVNEKFHKLFGGAPRKPESLIKQKDMNIAASIQKVTEEVVLKIAKNIAYETKSKNLCLAGGVALNCVANGKLIKENIFKNIWIQPASGDAGGSIGAALAAYYLFLDKPRSINKYDSMKGSYLGPSYSEKEISSELNLLNAKYHILKDKELFKKVAFFISKGKAVGWFNGAMEFGPRALGGRSILADPRSKIMQKNLNLKIKYRESFRPFAPSILIEDIGEWFDLNSASPYMLVVSDVKKSKQLKTNINKKLFGIKQLNQIRSKIPAVTHIDYSARIQTVNKKINPRYYALIREFKKLTGCPILVNTSFNIRGEPIVCSPKDAFKCFMGTELDILVINNHILLKKEQNKKLKENYLNKYELD